MSEPSSSSKSSLLWDWFVRGVGALVLATLAFGWNTIVELRDVTEVLRRDIAVLTREMGFYQSTLSRTVDKLDTANDRLARLEGLARRRADDD